MTYAKRNFERNARLSRVEVAALTQEVLERARAALRDSRELASPGAAGEQPARVPSETGLRPARAKRARAGAPPSFGAMLACRARQDFECLTIALCVLFSGAAWVIQSSGAYA